MRTIIIPMYIIGLSYVTYSNLLLLTKAESLFCKLRFLQKQNHSFVNLGAYHSYLKNTPRPLPLSYPQATEVSTGYPQATEVSTGYPQATKVSTGYPQVLR